MSPAEVEYRSQKDTKRDKKKKYYFDRLKDALGEKYAKKSTSRG